MNRNLPAVRTETHVLVGTRDQVANVLRQADHAGRLVHIGDIYPMDRNKIRVTVDLLPQPQPRPQRRPHPQPQPQPQPQPYPRRRRVHPAAITAVITAVLGITALIGWLIYLVVTYIAAHIALILGALALIVGAVVFLGRAGACPGIHCPGCRHR